MNSKVKYSAILLAIYTVLYFGIALMVSATFKDIAAIEIAGAPLAILGGAGCDCYRCHHHTSLS